MSRSPSFSQPRSITVAQVVLGLRIGGLERVVANLVRGLRGSHYRCVVCCLEDGGDFLADVTKDAADVKIFGKRDGLDLNCFRALAQYLRAERVDIVHTHNPAPHLYGVTAARMAGVPVTIHTKHGRNYPNIRQQVLLNRVLSWFTDRIVPVSDNAQEVVVHLEKVNRTKVHRIWNGVDTSGYVPAFQKQLEPIIGTVARLAAEKDQDTMLRAFSLVLERIPESRLVLVGDGICMKQLRDTAESLGISRSVDFLGARVDVAEILHTFSLFALSSTTEGMSMTILEAMSAGLPIVATDVGGNREIVQPPHCGLIVPARNPRALAEAFLNLLSNPNKRDEMSLAARARVIQHFSIERMVENYMKLYESMLSVRRVTTSGIHPGVS